MRFLPLELVKEGYVVGLPIYDNYGNTLVNKGFKLTNTSIIRLKEKGISAISIEDVISKGIETYDNISQKITKSSIKHLQNLDLDKTMKDANRIVDEIIECDEVYEYFNNKTFDNYTYEHSIAVSTYATMMGLACGFNLEEVRKLAIAGILHDIGKKCINDNILQKPSKLTDEEYEKIKQHSSLGYNMIKYNTNLPATVKIVILEHHENEDGSGYPRHLKSNDIYKFSKIVHIVDVYDALISNRPYKKPMNPKDAIDYIIKNTGTMFDEKYVNIFVQVIPSYPKGSVVKLTNGEKAIVLKNIKENIHKPIVRILNTKKVIKLYEMNDLDILEKLNE